MVDVAISSRIPMGQTDKRLAIQRFVPMIKDPLKRLRIVFKLDILYQKSM
jgi:hypothetical protein